MDKSDFFVPEYCEYYKTLTVEEIYFNPFPHEQHYGKCAIIGFTVFSSNRHFLENVKINYLPRSLGLPSGYCKILLLTSLLDKPLPINKTCEVFGELVLIDKCEETLNALPKTAKDINTDLRAKYENRNFQPDVAKLKSQFQPAIRIHTINIVDQAEKLIECNLAIRLMQKYQNKTF